MSDLVLCGAFLNEDNMDEMVYCDPHTGDLIVETALRGNLLIGNVSVSNPINMEGIDFTQLRTGTGSIGVAMTEQYLLCFKSDMSVDYRLTYRPHEVYTTSTYDLDADYEGIIE